MKLYRLVGAFVILTVMPAWIAPPVQADRDRRKHREKREKQTHQEKRLFKKVGKEREHYFYDNRYNHNRYYPKRGYTVRELPPKHRVFRHRRDRYYYDDGIWYRPSVSGYVVVNPPIGLMVPFLPPFYTTIWVGRSPYYYADGVYYVWNAEERVYLVSDPPPEKEVIPETAIPDKLFIYPKKGQTPEQQATDRYECHRWSVDQTGFDPTRAGGNVARDEQAAKQLQYQRAMKACLEARNYSVQ